MESEMKFNPNNIVQFTGEEYEPLTDELRDRLIAEDAAEWEAEQGKPPSPPRKSEEGERERVKWVPNVPISIDVYERFMDLAEMVGMRPSDFARMVIESLIPKWAIKREMPEDMRMWWLIWKANQEIRLHEEIDRIAISQENRYIAKNDERLLELCERTSNDLAGVKERAKHNVKSYPLLAQVSARHRTKKDRCRVWLANVTGSVDEVSSFDLSELSRKDDYTSNMVAECLREAGWQAEKSGRNWVWRRSPIAKLSNEEVSG